MGILTLLQNWKAALMAMLSGAVLIMYGLFKYKSNKLDDAEEEIKSFTLRDEVQKQQQSESKEIIENEDKQIIEELHLNAKKSRSDKFNGL